MGIKAKKNKVCTFSVHVLFFFNLASIVSLWLFESTIARFTCKYYQLLIRRVTAHWLCTKPSTVSVMTRLSCQLHWIWSQLREDKPIGTPRRGFLDRVSRNGKVHPKHGQHFWVVSQSKEVQGKKLSACLPSGLTGEFIYSVTAAITPSTDIRTQSSAFYMDQWPAALQEYSRCLVQTGIAKTSSS